MLNINDLESRWLKYKIKSYIPHISIFLSFVVILTLVFIIGLKPTEIKQVVAVEEQAPKIVPTPAVNNKIVQKTIPTPTPTINNYQKTLLSPSFGFINKMQEGGIPNHKPLKISKKEPVVVIPKIKIVQVPKIIKQEKQKAIKPDVKPQKEKETSKKETSISIVKQTTQNDINEVVKRFNKNNNPALSLFIAKKYYELGEYRKSYNYSLKTNNINNDMEASWIIFAKSLVKLDEKEMAIKILRKYISHSDSNRAQLLLNNILSGKFR